MATITIAQARYLNNVDGKATPLRGGRQFPNIKETASQTYAQGAPIYYDTNGTIAVAVAGSNKVDKLAGFALEAASGTTGQPVRYRPLRVGDRLLMNLKGSSTTTTALTLLDDLCNFDLHTGNLLCANPDSATTDGSKVLGKIVEIYTVAGGYQDGDAIGDTYGRVIVQIMSCFTLQG
jgi:hypothetical protein